MLDDFFKFLAIIFWSLIIFNKSMPGRSTVKTVTVQLVLACAAAAAVMLKDNIFIELTNVTLMLFILLINKVTHNHRWSTNTIVSVISYGLAHIAYITAGVIMSAVYAVFYTVFEIEKDFFFTRLAVYALMLVPINLLFKIKRFRGGFVYISNKGIGLTGAVIAFTIPTYYSYLRYISNHRYDDNLILFLTITGIIALGVIFIIWWRTAITKSYRDGLMAQEILRLKEDIKMLEASNVRMARLIHSDTKLIPALLYAAGQLAQSEERNDLLEELNKASANRKGIIKQAERERDGVTFESTGNASLDAVLRYMCEKAAASGIEVYAEIDAEFFMVGLISDDDLRLVTADLLDNAILAAKRCEYKAVLYKIAETGGVYEVSVYDSGVPFPQEILPVLGTRQVTTRADDGGSGIGMLEIFGAAEKTRATLIIESIPQYLGEVQMFTKRVCLRFDGENRRLL